MVVISINFQSIFLSLNFEAKDVSSDISLMLFEQSINSLPSNKFLASNFDLNITSSICSKSAL